MVPEGAGCSGSGRVLSMEEKRELVQPLARSAAPIAAIAPVLRNSIKTSAGLTGTVKKTRPLPIR
jgi:hypothetical protein